MKGQKCIIFSPLYAFMKSQKCIYFWSFNAFMKGQNAFSEPSSKAPPQCIQEACRSLLRRPLGMERPARRPPRIAAEGSAQIIKSQKS